MEKEKVDERIYPANAIRVCIDWSGDDFSGRIYSKMWPNPILFENCSEMLLRADELFDMCGYPQSFQDKRIFSEKKQNGKYGRPQIYLSDEEIYSQHGKYRTVDIFIHSRRRASWQGSILDQDGKIIAEFRSGLELLGCLGYTN